MKSPESIQVGVKVKLPKLKRAGIRFIIAKKLIELAERVGRIKVKYYIEQVK